MRTRKDRQPNQAEMRNNQRLTIEQLREEARLAVEASGKRQSEIARALEVSEGALSRALREEGTHFAELLGRVVESLLGYRVEREPPTWRARKVD